MLPLSSESKATLFHLILERLWCVSVPVTALLSYLSVIHFNIINPTASLCYKWCHSLRILYQNRLYTCLLSLTYCMTCPSNPLWSDRVKFTWSNIEDLYVLDVKLGVRFTTSRIKVVPSYFVVFFSDCLSLADEATYLSSWRHNLSNIPVRVSNLSWCTTVKLRIPQIGNNKSVFIFWSTLSDFFSWYV